VVFWAFGVFRAGRRVDRSRASPVIVVGIDPELVSWSAGFRIAGGFDLRLFCDWVVCFIFGHLRRGGWAVRRRVRGTHSSGAVACRWCANICGQREMRVTTLVVASDRVSGDWLELGGGSPPADRMLLGIEVPARTDQIAMCR